MAWEGAPGDSRSFDVLAVGRRARCCHRREPPPRAASCNASERISTTQVHRTDLAPELGSIRIVAAGISLGRLPAYPAATNGGPRTRAREDAIEEGTRVKLHAAAFDHRRPHLLWHARRHDVGMIARPSKQSPGMSQLYIIVRFDQCGHDHLLREDEIEIVG